MDSSTNAEEKLYNCIKCKEEFYTDLDPKILEIVGGSLLCDSCSKTHVQDDSSTEQDPNPAENSSVSGNGGKAKNVSDNVYTCDLCRLTFSGVGDVCAHLKPILALFEKHSICQVCQKTFATRTELKMHILSHTKEKPHVCTVCQKAFTRVAHLKMHVRTHTGEKPYICDVCDETFARRHHLIAHVSSHAEEKPFKCDECSATFVHVRDLKRHIRAHTEGKPYKCDECSAAFSAPSLLKIHERIHTGEKPFVCDVCDKSYRVRASLQQHMLVHTGERPFACHLCDRTFTRKIYLKNHIRCHTGEKPYVCKVCNAAFSQRFQIAKHSCEQDHGKSTTMFVKSPTPALCKPIHAKEKFVGVGIYEKATAQRGQLQRQKPFSCGDCEKEFSTVYDLKFHLRTHPEEKTFECDLCKKLFLKASSLKVHQWRCHKLDWSSLKYTKNKD